MTHALALALRGTGYVSPNPRVGCVIVANNEIIAEGWHAVFGGPHAEVAALSSMGLGTNSPNKLPENATVYVTLEPCSHEHKTPPCTDALLAAGVRHVVVGIIDPYPLVCGRGIAMLRDHGATVDVGVCEDACAWVNRTFIKYVTTAQPYVVLKMAQTLDGFAAPLSRTRQTITSTDSRATVHALRAEFDAVLIGIGTALADDPQLTVRDVAGRNPVRVVLDRRCLLTISSNLVQTARDVPTIVACNAEHYRANATWISALTAHGVEVIEVDDNATLPSLLTTLGARGIASILCEGGARLAAALMGQHLVDELHIHIAPVVMGDGLHWMTRDASVSWQLRSLERVGSDVHLLLLPASS